MSILTRASWMSPVLACALASAVVQSQSSWTWTQELVDTAQGVDVGFDSALVFDPSGNASVAYGLHGAQTVKFARRQSNGTWTTEIVDGAARGNGLGDGAQAIALAYNPLTRHPAVSYGWVSLRLAEWTGRRWNVQTVAKGAYPFGTALAYDASGEPLIAYRESTKNRDLLRLARRSGSTWIIETVDADQAGYWPSMVLDHGRPVIAYIAGSPQHLRLARRNENGSWNIQAIAGPRNQPSLAVDLNGHLALVAQGQDSTLWYLHQEPGGGFTTTTTQPETGRHARLSFIPTGDAVVAYEAFNVADPNSPQSIRLRRVTEMGDFISDTEVAHAAPGGKVRHPELALDSDGWPHLSYCSKSATTTMLCDALMFARPQ